MYLERYNEAEQLYRESLAIMQSAFNPGHPYITRVKSNLTILLSHLKKPE